MEKEKKTNEKEMEKKRKQMKKKTRNEKAEKKMLIEKEYCKANIE